jgi:hypothetical protein
MALAPMPSPPALRPPVDCVELRFDFLLPVLELAELLLDGSVQVEHRGF